MNRLRSSVFALLLVTLVLLVSGAHLLHEQLALHPVSEHCDLCRFSSDTPDLLVAVLPVAALVLFCAWRWAEPGYVVVRAPRVLSVARGPPESLLAV